MSRSLKKGPFVDFKLAKKVAALGPDDRTIIKTWARASTISPEMVGRTIATHIYRVCNDSIYRRTVKSIRRVGIP